MIGVYILTSRLHQRDTNMPKNDIQMPKHHPRLTQALSLAFTGLSLLLLSTPARADLNRFAYTYGWWTQTKGGRELEFFHTQPKSGREWHNQIELEYGVTERYLVAPYILLDRSGGFSDFPGADGGGESDEEGSGSIFDPIRNGRAYRYKGFKVEQRYRFGDYGIKKLLPAAYLEYARVKGESPELEGKVILQFDPNYKTTISLNLIAEHYLKSGASFEYSYSSGIAYLADKNDRYWYGAEAFGNTTNHEHWAGPTVGTFIGKETRLVGTYAHTLSHGADQFRLVATRQF